MKNKIVYLLKNIIMKSMKIYELQFNPEKKGKVCKTFQYKPKDPHRAKKGRLYMAGEIYEKETPFLQELFEIAKDSYYENSSRPEHSLKKALLEVNEFIKKSKKGKKGNIALLCSKSFDIHFSRIGEMKILLLSNNKIEDIGKELNNSHSDSFQNLISGKISKNEKLVIATPEIYDFFHKEKILEEIKKGLLGNDTMERISSLQKEKFPDVSGVALIMSFSGSPKDSKRKFFSGAPKERFSFKKMAKENISYVKNIFSKLNFSGIKNMKLPDRIKRIPFREKSVYLPLILVVIIIMGSTIIGIERKVRADKDQKKIISMEEKMLQKKEKEDMASLKELFSELNEFKNKTILKEEAEILLNKMEEELLLLSETEVRSDVQLLGKIEDMNPEKIMAGGENLFLYSSQESKVVILEPENGEITSYSLPIEKGIDLSSFSGERAIFFSSPDHLIFFENGHFSERIITLPEDHNNFISLSSFMGIPYFLNTKGEIMHYPEERPQPWIKKGEDKMSKAISIAIDGSIFALTSKSDIYHYYRGEKKETINPLIFPPLKDGRKLYTDSETPLVIHDPQENRIVLIGKKGETISQIIYEKDDVVDIAVSRGGKKIYLLTQKEVYLIEI